MFKYTGTTHERLGGKQVPMLQSKQSETFTEGEGELVNQASNIQKGVLRDDNESGDPPSNGTPPRVQFGPKYGPDRKEAEEFWRTASSQKCPCGSNFGYDRQGRARYHLLICDYATANTALVPLSLVKNTTAVNQDPAEDEEDIFERQRALYWLSVLEENCGCHSEIGRDSDREVRHLLPGCKYLKLRDRIAAGSFEDIVDDEGRGL
ncbi:hypothetical protein GALMADRAFT_232768 [Galerina marginata CBS 339.88]|uniref:Uncharacterized protein n=1 Tax=Galerina marginata (strain CBS 339.88) TaxID=685588 RepID=A0A067S7U0_GALM3|nr:hypothetical protein GALMADRAFT_232768 [Galerina marginata CBS 339.88]